MNSRDLNLSDESRRVKSTDCRIPFRWSSKHQLCDRQSSKDAPLIPIPCSAVRHWSRCYWEWTSQVKLRLLISWLSHREVFLDFLGRHRVISRPLESRIGRQRSLMREEWSERSELWRGLHPPLLTWRRRSPEPGNRGASELTVTSCQDSMQLPSRTESRHNQEGSGSRYSPAHTLTVRSSVDDVQAVWSFVTKR